MESMQEQTPHPPVIVHPLMSGGRRVTVRGADVGRAHRLQDVAEFLRRAGLADDEADLGNPALVAWRGGGPDTWT
jgi:hypothetical protein